MSLVLVPLPGSTWVYSIYKQVQSTNPQETATYCSSICYYFAFWFITALWILLFLILMLMLGIVAFFGISFLAPRLFHSWSRIMVAPPTALTDSASVRPYFQISNRRIEFSCSFFHFVSSLLVTYNYTYQKKRRILILSLASFLRLDLHLHLLPKKLNDTSLLSICLFEIFIVRRLLFFQLIQLFSLSPCLYSLMYVPLISSSFQNLNERNQNAINTTPPIRDGWMDGWIKVKFQRTLSNWS